MSVLRANMVPLGASQLRAAEALKCLAKRNCKSVHQGWSPKESESGSPANNRHKDKTILTLEMR